MKKLLLLSVLFAACTKVQTIPTINLGIGATSTKINSVFPPVTTGKVTVDMDVTPGAKYSIQLTDMKGVVKEATGFTASSTAERKTIDYSDRDNGDYFVVLIDIKGTETKQVITIKK